MARVRKPLFSNEHSLVIQSMEDRPDEFLCFQLVIYNPIQFVIKN